GADQGRPGEGWRACRDHRGDKSGTGKASRRLSGRAGDLLALGQRYAGAARRHDAAVAGARPMTQALRILIVLAAIMGADGVILAAASTHQADASRLASASSMC